MANDGKTANNYMFWPLKRPSSGCTFSEKSCTIYNVSSVWRRDLVHRIT